MDAYHLTRDAWTEVSAAQNYYHAVQISLGSTFPCVFKVATSLPAADDYEGAPLDSAAVQTIYLDAGEKLYARAIQRSCRLLTEASASLSGALRGMCTYADTEYTSGSPFTPAADQWTNLPNNAGTVLASDLPDGVSLYDEATLKTLFENGDDLCYTVELIGKPTTATATFLSVAMFIGNNRGPLADGRIYSRELSFPKGQNVVRIHTFSTDGWAGADWEANGGIIQVNPNAAIEIYSIRYILKLRNRNPS